MWNLSCLMIGKIKYLTFLVTNLKFQHSLMVCSKVKLWASPSLALHQTMINTEKSKIAMQKTKSAIAKANKLPPGNGNTNFVIGIFLQHIF